MKTELAWFFQIWAAALIFISSGALIWSDWLEALNTPWEIGVILLTFLACQLAHWIFKISYKSRYSRLPELSAQSYRLDVNNEDWIPDGPPVTYAGVVRVTSLNEKSRIVITQKEVDE